MDVKWESRYELGICMRWGIYAHGEYKRTARSGGKGGSTFGLVMRWCVDAIDSRGQRNAYRETGQVPIADSHGRDSYMPLISQTSYEIMIRERRMDSDSDLFWRKAFALFFDAAEHRFDDAVPNLSPVTQIFEQPISRPEIVYCDMEKDSE
jgi:hypothetical protein